MVRFGELEQLAGDVAAVGRQLLQRPDRGEVAILATVDDDHRPHVAPVCPIFCGAGCYLSLSALTPKRDHLARSGCYALHAQVGADDLEFQMRGAARLLEPSEERDRVIDAIPFPSYDAADPIVELLISHALAVTWSAGQRHKRSFRAP